MQLTDRPMEADFDTLFLLDTVEEGLTVAGREIRNVREALLKLARDSASLTTMAKILTAGSACRLQVAAREVRVVYEEVMKEMLRDTRKARQVCSTGATILPDGVLPAANGKPAHRPRRGRRKAKEE